MAGTAVAALGVAWALPSPAVAADTCPNAAVRAQQGSSSLPDCRAWEIVNRNTDDVNEANRVSNMADDGNTAVYLSAIPTDISLGGGVAAISVARRSATGWTSVSADPFSLAGLGGNTGITTPRVFSLDYKRALITTNLPATPSDQNGNIDLYAIDVGLGTGTWMSQGLSTTPSELLGATSNLDRVVFHFTGGGPVGGLYASDGNSLELMSLYPDGTPVPDSQVLQAGAAYQRGWGVGTNRDSDPFVERGGNHGVSDDARRLYFYDTFGLNGGLLYVRDHQTTVPVTASQRTTGDGGTIYNGRFISASHDGSIAYVQSDAQLTDDATPGGGIYRFELETRTLTQITPASAGGAPLDLPGAMSSDDMSHVYFTSTAALGGGAQSGDQNAYVWSSGTGVVRFIAKVEAGDRFTRVTPDGRYALLLSTASVNGAPNNGLKQIYRYDAQTQEVACVSCRPDGSPSTGSADIDAQGPGFPSGGMTHGRAFTLDGRVVFTSSDRLDPNDQTSAVDVYLYDRGKVSLLTAGRGDTNSYVGDVSDDGRNVFVMTRSALISSDRDAQEYDVYDVRVDGGFLEPAPPSDRCRGDDCQAAATPTPAAVEPTSPRVVGEGNAAPKKLVKKLGVTRLSSAQRSVLARTGKVAITARVDGGGTVSLRGRGRLGGVTKTVGSVSEAVLKRNESTVKLTFKLSTAARRELARRHRLSFTLEARLSGLSKVTKSSVTLTKAKARR
jgi:hypothetical protein